MKHFMIRYKRTTGTEQEWHQDIARFIGNLEQDPELKGRILYRCMQVRGSDDYFHLAAAADEQAIKAMQSRDFFKRYTERTRLAAGGEVTVSPLDIVAETGQ